MHGGPYSSTVRTPALLLALLLFPVAAHAGGEVDLTPRARNRTRPPKLVLRAEGGNEFAPYGYAGGCLSYLTDDGFQFELGAGAGFPGLQFGFATRRLFGSDGSYFLFELYLAGNPKVNRGASDADLQLNAQAKTASSSLWTSVGGGFEQRLGWFDLSLAGGLVLTTASFTPHFSVHGGLGIGF